MKPRRNTRSSIYYSDLHYWRADLQWGCTTQYSTCGLDLELWTPTGKDVLSSYHIRRSIQHPASSIPCLEDGGNLPPHPFSRMFRLLAVCMEGGSRRIGTSVRLIYSRVPNQPIRWVDDTVNGTRTELNGRSRNILEYDNMAWLTSKTLFRVSSKVWNKSAPKFCPQSERSWSTHTRTDEQRSLQAL